MENNFDQKKVLVVDNSPVMAKIIKNHLIKLGFKSDDIHTASQGNQAYLMTELAPFDLVTTGVHMKNKNGLDLVSLMREHSDENIRSIPVLVITAESREYFENELKNLGVNGFLRKPFNLKKMEQVINEIFNPSVSVNMDLAQSILNDIEGKETELLKTDWGERLGDTFHPDMVSAFVDSALEAFGQYMVTAEPGDPDPDRPLSGDFSSSISLVNKERDLRLQLVLYFPKEVACSIYEGIFGEADLGQVCGVVEELGNIMAGNVKPRISEFANEIVELIHPELEGADANGISFDLGLPSTRMDDNHELSIKDPMAPKFSIPFMVDGQSIDLQVVFYKNSVVC